MGSGSIKRKVMIIGEAPGENEAVTGRVFSGRAGKLLDTLLEEAGLDRSHCYVTNVVKCRPPENRRPDRVEFEACRVYLEREAKAVNPRWVLLLGNAALQAVARKSGITKQRGLRLKVRDPVWANRHIMATFHPAYILRNPGQHSTLAEDVKRFARMMRGEFQVVPVRSKYVNSVEGVKWLRRQLEALPEGSVVSYDVENRGRPWEGEWDVVCLGISWDGKTTYVEHGGSTQGEWSIVRDGEFSSFWPPDYRAAYTLRWIVEDGAVTGLSFIQAGRGDRFDGRYE